MRYYMDEIWKDIEGYEGLYQVSNLGNVKSLDRNFVVLNKKGFKQHIRQKGRLLKKQNGSCGYKIVNLSKDNIHKTHMIHRLVAKTFLPNPLNLPEVNHKDECKDNNALYNLEWCTSKYNANYGTRNQRCICQNQIKPVNQLSKNGDFIKRWDSITDAHKALNIDMSQISGVCKHKKEYVTAGGYKWEYAI